MDLDHHMKMYKLNKGDKIFTHTKIGDDKLNIYGGCYNIPDDKMKEFYKYYKKFVFQQKKESYLTEKQLEKGPILIDLDFRYDPSIDEKQHNMEHIISFVELLFESIQQIKKIKEENYKCHIFEKPDVNTSNEDITKDGIHIIVNIQMDFHEKILLRNILLNKINSIFEDLPIINSWDQVIDDGVMKGNVNWQLYGSQKPGNEAYELKYAFDVSYHDEWSIEEVSFDEQYIEENFHLLIARNTILHELELCDSIKDEYDKLKQQRSQKTRKCKVNILSSINFNKEFSEISSMNELDQYIEHHITKNTLNEHFIRETHEYTLLLDESYYQPGSYNKWIRVGMALKNTHPKLFLTWLKLSSQSDNFDWNEIDSMYNVWENFNEDEGLTMKSIIYWCKECNLDEFYELHKKSIQKYIHYSFNNITDYDIAYVLYQGYKDSYVCVNIKNSVWYEFIQNKWEQIDSGTNLRKKLSNEIFNEYSDYSKRKQNELDDKDELKEIISKFTKISKALKSTNDKNNIMKEAREIFYDNEFYNKLDSNPYLIGCKNCIIDIKNQTYRKGRHEDYISLSTQNEYKPIEYYQKNKSHIIDEVNEFMGQLFPEKELCDYMWEHLASTLVGVNENQTFNIYTGSGANGKSKLVELMQKVLGDYKGTIPSALITQKRNNIGSTSSEVHQLIGKRYAVMNEPSKGDTINEGIMKEITGGDPIQCRALFKDSVTFVPQFKLAVCTNVLYDIKSNDDGTWRRIRVCEFKSKFTDKPYEDPSFPEKNYPYQYKIDTKLDSKFKEWVPVFLSMLVEVAFRTLGKVHDRPCVLEPTNKYRQGQDIFLEFCNLHIQNSASEYGNLKIGFVTDLFKQWHSNEYGNQKSAPRPKELRDYLEKKYGHYPTSGWSNISIKEEFI